MYDVLIIIQVVQQVEHIADGPILIFLYIQTTVRPTSDATYATGVMSIESCEYRPNEVGYYQR